jgi:hypothetical protein
MKIQVMRCDGNTETLELTGTLHVEGDGGLVDDATGKTHFFRAEDGAYDGWGIQVDDDLNEEDVRKVVDAVEQERKIHLRDGAL